MHNAKFLSFILKIFYVLGILSFLLPWFTYDASIMGYRRGYIFLFLFLIPVILIGFCLFLNKPNRLFRILAQISMVWNLICMVIALGIWQEVCNIKSGFHLLEGIKTAQPGFWFAAVVNIALFILYQINAGQARAAK